MPATDYKPTTADVAAELRSRLVTGGGARLENFNATSRPTQAEVENIIDRTLGKLSVVLGADIPEGPARNAARDVVALRAAMRVERTFFSEQVGTDTSLYKALKDEYDDDLPNAIKAANQARQIAGDTSADVGESQVMPVSTLSPSNSQPHIGWGTYF